MKSKYSSFTVGTEPDYNPKAWLCSPTKIGESENCHPWASRGRRLFPQRRPSIPSPVSRSVEPFLGFPPFGTSASGDRSPVDHQEYDSNPSSPRSIGSDATVQVHMFPTPYKPFSETDPRVGEDVRICTPYLAESVRGSCSVEGLVPHDLSNRELETGFSAPLYTDTPARGNLQWKSMAQFHNFRRRLGPGSRQSPESTAYAGLRPVKVHQEWGQEEDQDKSGPDIPALEIVPWDCTVKLSTIATVTSNGRLHVYHLAVLSVITPKRELYAEKIGLSIVIANALRKDRTRSLGPGQSSLLFKEDVCQPGFFPREGAELLVVRESCDLEKSLNLYFAFTYSSPSDFFMASLPTFRPKEGRSLSEVVFIAEPLPPLRMTTFTRDPLSSWKLCHHPVSQVTCYERIDLPRLSTAGSRDDIQMRILELDPVHFRALRESNLSSVVWELDLMVRELPGELVECRMRFFFEVGTSTALVCLVPHAWVPRYFIVDGRVATEKGGECWKNKEGHIIIFKQAHMAPGSITVDTYWQGPPKYDKLEGYNLDNPPLPRVADRKVLGGRLTCVADEGKDPWQQPSLHLLI